LFRAGTTDEDGIIGVAMQRGAQAIGFAASEKQAIDAASAKAGFTPNVFLAYAWKPEHFRAFFQYYETLMRGESGLSRAEREMIVVAVSAVNSCTYCTVTHGAALRILSKDPYVADHVSANYRHADLTPRERAMLDFLGQPTQCIVPELRRFVAELHGFVAHGIGAAAKSVGDAAQRRGDAIGDVVRGLRGAGGGAPAGALQPLLDRAQAPFDFADIGRYRAGISGLTEHH